MKPNFLDVLIIAVLEMTLTKLEQENAKLREQAAGYDRLRSAHDQLKAVHATELRKAEGDALYINDLHHRARTAEGQVADLREQLLELGRKNIALAAEAESATHLEEALDKANRRVDELEVALTLMRLPAASMNNVIALIQEQAA